MDMALGRVEDNFALACAMIRQAMADAQGLVFTQDMGTMRRILLQMSRKNLKLTAKLHLSKRMETRSL